MLEREYYTNKNMVGRDKLYFILKRKYGSKAPTQAATPLSAPAPAHSAHSLVVVTAFLRPKTLVRLKRPSS